MAREFSGATDRVQIATYTAIQSLTTASFGCWLSYDTDTGSTSRFMDLSNNAYTMVLNDSGATNDFQIHVRHWSDTVGIWIWDGPAMDGWHYWTFTYDGGSVENEPDLYKDGVLYTAGKTRVLKPVGTLGTYTDPFTIGNDVTSTRNFGGSVCEVGHWNRVLGADEVKTAYLQGAGRAPGGLVLYCPVFGLSSPEPNYAPTGGNGTVTGATLVAHAPFGPPFGFDVNSLQVEAAVGELSIPVAMNSYRQQHQSVV